ncbi:DUF6851 domain-containing protein [Massilia sp. W12]|uniref:vanadium-dependent haloperoxidase n=1 Tax=Massilia sp. W12 TaxID=3126507 RepID=UPI0030D4B7F7
MKKRDFLRLCAVTGGAAALPGCGGDTATPAAAPPKVVILWSGAALDAVRQVKPGPPMVARALAIIHTAMYDAWAAYDAVALGTRLHGALRRPAEERSAEAKARAMSQAAYAACMNLFPTQKTTFDGLMTKLGFTTSTSLDPALPAGVGNLAAQALLDYRRGDGANQDGRLSASGLPYSDYTGYAPANPPALFTEATPQSAIVAPERWQPLTFFDASGKAVTPGFIAPHWKNVTPFALSSAAQFRPPAPAPLGSPLFRSQAQEVLDYAINLSEKQKVIAEYWADGPSSELPPGHWCLFAQWLSEQKQYDNDQDVKLFFALANAVFDAGIATWEAKRFYDYVRPVTAIRFLFAGQTIQGFGAEGPAAGLQSIQGEAWRPFQKSSFPTPPFAEHTSGHSAFSAASAEILKNFSGSDQFGMSVTIAAKTLQADPKLPLAPVTLSWPTFSAAAEEAGLSRLLGGIHFSAGNTAGLALGRQVGQAVWARAKAYWEGRA